MYTNSIHVCHVQWKCMINCISIVNVTSLSLFDVEFTEINVCKIILEVKVCLYSHIAG